MVHTLSIGIQLEILGKMSKHVGVTKTWRNSEEWDWNGPQVRYIISPGHMPTQEADQ
jgi:hypothetical protein